LKDAVFGIRDGGLAVYGGVLLAVLFAFIYIRGKKLPFAPVADLAALALPIGQCIGRWGNFVNQEAYGAATAGALPWGMTGSRIQQDLINQGYGADVLYNANYKLLVHPCFLYESLWCLLGAILLLLYYNYLRRFDGEVALLYVAWYGFGRAFIEGLRTDSLYVGTIRVSQLVAIISAVFAATVYARLKMRRTEGLFKDTVQSKHMFEKYAAVTALNKK
jgi:phosphatidylglycerol:prolipoprotein diacylglycerol transferase